MIYIMINESARCLEEGVIDQAGACDIAMVMGTGFPPHRAGLLRYADKVGIKNIVKDLKQFQNELKQDRFEPSPYLLQMVKENRSFYSN